jgi:O-antigen ligase
VSSVDATSRGVPFTSRVDLGAGARSGLIAAAVAVVAVVGGYGIATGSPRATAALFGLTLAGALCIAVPLRTVASGLLYVAAATAGINSARIGGAFTVTDACVLGAAVILLPSLLGRRRIEGLNGLYLTAGGLIVLGSFLGAMSTSAYSSNLAPIAKLVIAAFGVYAVFLAWQPSVRECWRFVALYVASACASVIWGIVHLDPYTQRAEGLMVHENHLALVSLLALGPALVAALSFRGRPGLLATLATAILITGIAASGSRAGLVGVVAIVLTALLVAARGRAGQIAVVAALGVAVALPLFVFVSPSQNALTRAISPSSASAAQSDTGRRQLISEALALVEDHPLTGAGLEAAKQPHDIFLGLLAGGGPIALLGVLLLVAVPLDALSRARKGTGSVQRNPLVTGLAIGAIGFFTACLFQNTIWDRYLWLPLALLALLARRGGRAPE